MRTSPVHLINLAVAGLAGLTFLTMAPAVAVAEELPVVDFCALDVKKPGAIYQKQRLVLFNMLGLGKVEAGEVILNDKGEQSGSRQVLAQVKGAEHFMEVWASTFPMRRFYNVMSPEAAPADFLTRESLTVGEVQAAFKGDYSDFLARSVGCTDYLAAPHLKAFEANWRSQQVKKMQGDKEVTVTVHSLSVVPTVELAVFRRDGQRFVRVERLEESGGGLFDFTADLGAMTMAIAKPGNEVAGKVLRDRFDSYQRRSAAVRKRIKALNDEATEARLEVERLNGLVKAAGADADDALEDLKEAQATLDELLEVVADFEQQLDTMVSLVEDPMGNADKMARAANKGWRGLVSGMPKNDGACGQGPKELFQCPPSPFWLPEREVGVAGMSERAGSFCASVNGEKVESVAPCELRVRTENISLLVQEAAQGVEGWRLYAPLQLTVADPDSEDDDADEVPGVALGEKEGVDRGTIFLAVRLNDQGEREVDGFARVVRPGPGGELGPADPSTLTWRTGRAPRGTRMEEHPQIGVSLTVLGAATTALDISDEPLVQGLGTLAGASLDVGYNLTKYTEWSWGELWLRTHLEVAFGGAAGAEISSPAGDINTLTYAMFNVLAGSELKLYLMPRVDLFISAAGGISALSVSTPDNKLTITGQEEEQDDSGTGLSLGSLVLGGGLDLILHPDWQLRLGADFRQNLQDITLQPPEDIEAGASIFNGQSAGTLSGLMFKAGLTYIF